VHFLPETATLTGFRIISGSYATSAALIIQQHTTLYMYIHRDPKRRDFATIGAFLGSP